METNDLKSHEKTASIIIGSLLMSLPRKGGLSRGWPKVYAKAWGVCPRTINSQLIEYVKKGLTTERKTHSDAGFSDYSCEGKKNNHLLHYTSIKNVDTMNFVRIQVTSVKMN